MASLSEMHGCFKQTWRNLRCCTLPPAKRPLRIWEVFFSNHQTNLHCGGDSAHVLHGTPMVTCPTWRTARSPHLGAVSFCWVGGPLLKGGSVPSRNLWFPDLSVFVGSHFGRVACAATLERKFLCPFSWGWRVAVKGGSLAVEPHQCFLKLRLSSIHPHACVWLQRGQPGSSQSARRT